MTDGLLIGFASAMPFCLALTLAAGQVLADVPECYEAVANFRKKGLTMRGRMPATVFLLLLAWLLSLHPTAAGRVYAAYGGVYIGVAIVWTWQADVQ